MRTIDAAERRARLARRHRLAEPASDPVEVARAIVAYHATDPASVYLSMAARTGLAPPGALDKALYDDRTLVRMLGMRRTMFVVPVESVQVVHRACTEAIAVTERRRTLQMIAEGGIADPEGWLDRVQADTVEALRRRGEATTRELGDDVPDLRAEVVLAPGKKYETKATLAPRVLFQLSAEGLAVRGRPVKSWVSNYRWALTETWLPGGMPEVTEAAAERELAYRWLAAFGPGTVADLKWWTGWTLGRSRRVLAELGAVEVALDAGATGYVLPDDVAPVAAAEPWAALLPALDPAVMGWAMASREWYLGEDVRAAVYDRNGNIGPTVWWDGRIVGGWAQRADGTIVHRLLSDAGAEAEQAIERQADEVRAWLGDVRVTPRFRTPLERELTS
jgi:Winged helix DNA-binding domain